MFDAIAVTSLLQGLHYELKILKTKQHNIILVHVRVINIITHPLLIKQPSNLIKISRSDKPLRGHVQTTRKSKYLNIRS